MGELRSEVRMPGAGSLSYRIPASTELNTDYVVQVRDGDQVLREATLGSMHSTPASPSEV